MDNDEVKFAPHSQSESVDDAIEFLKTSPLRVAVFGEFSAGKSTFLNAMIGEDLLSVAVEPTTAVPLIVRYSREFNIIVELKDSTDKRFFEDEAPFWARFVGRGEVLNTLQTQQNDIRNFLHRWTKEGERADEVKRIIMEMPLDWLKGKLELVDTPGTNNEFTQHHRLTEDVASEVDIAIYLIDARSGGGKKTEFDSMNEIHRRVGKSMLVVNKMDLLDEDEREELLDYIRQEALPQHWQGTVTPAVYGLSATSALRKDTNGKLQEEFDVFMSELQQAIRADRSKLLLKRFGEIDQQLFKRAVKLEQEENYEAAHTTYYQLYDLLSEAKLNTKPASDGIDRCEDKLKDKVVKLDDVNKQMNHAISLIDDYPDQALKEFKLCLAELNNNSLGYHDQNEEINKHIDILENRIDKRDKARMEHNDIMRIVNLPESHYKDIFSSHDRFLKVKDHLEYNNKDIENTESMLKQLRDNIILHFNSQLNHSLSLIDNLPDQALKELKLILSEIKNNPIINNNQIDDINKHIDILNNRIKKRDKAREKFEKIVQILDIHENNYKKIFIYYNRYNKIKDLLEFKDEYIITFDLKVNNMLNKAKHFCDLQVDILYEAAKNMIENNNIDSYKETLSKMVELKKYCSEAKTKDIDKKIAVQVKILEHHKRFYESFDQVVEILNEFTRPDIKADIIYLRINHFHNIQKLHPTLSEGDKDYQFPVLPFKNRILSVNKKLELINYVKYYTINKKRINNIEEILNKRKEEIEDYIYKDNNLCDIATLIEYYPDCDCYEDSIENIITNKSIINIKSVVKKCSNYNIKDLAALNIDIYLLKNINSLGYKIKTHIFIWLATTLGVTINILFTQNIIATICFYIALTLFVLYLTTYIYKISVINSILDLILLVNRYRKNHYKFVKCYENDLMDQLLKNNKYSDSRNCSVMRELFAFRCVSLL